MEPLAKLEEKVMRLDIELLFEPRALSVDLAGIVLFKETKA